MADINAKVVMQLRQKTGLSMMECKKALIETEGNLEAAEDALRKKLKGKMDTRTDRAAGEGCIAISSSDDGSAAILELRSETDFTAKNDNFREAAQKIADVMSGMPAGTIEANDEISAMIDELRISTGENVTFGRGVKVEGGTFGTYVHHDGKTGVLIQAEGEVTAETLRQLCMHITAAHPRPIGITTDDIPEAAVAKERKFRMEQAIESGKNEEIATMMVEGGMRKFFEEIALVEQPFVMDPSQKIKDILGGASVKSFFRWEIGETAEAPVEA